ncbi:MAG: hypothetical protein JNL63_11330, partial [Bacteroidia bacterium]|nr:hypothetical protein [Bacteroidia bacterium]
ASMAIKFNDKYGYAYLNRGIAKEMLRDETACKDWETAGKLGVEIGKNYASTCDK